jgi:hypothetical protein
MPILGILASSFRSAVGPQGAYDSLATVTLSASASAITFAGIPSGYKHLQIRYIARDSFAANVDYTTLKFNGATSGYAWHYLRGNGAAAQASAGTSASSIRVGFITYANDTANTFGAGIMDVLDYASTTKYKTMRNLNGADTNGAGLVALSSGLYQSTDAITSITFESAGTAYVANSTFALYGIR